MKILSPSKTFLLCTAFIAAGCGIPQTQDQSLSVSLEEKRVGDVAAFAAGLDENPEGLFLIGNYSAERKNVIFIHGWRQSTHPEMFVNAEGWQRAGFNTYVYRWHNDALDDGSACRLFGLAAFPCPNQAEQRVWGAGAFAGEKMVEAYKAYFKDKDAREIRIVGSSLGSQMATYLTYRLYDERWRGPKPTRVELLDVFAGSANINSGGSLPRDAVFPIPTPRGVRGSSCNTRNSNTIYCVLENGLHRIRTEFNVAMVNYSSIIGGATANDLHRVMNFQAFNGNWMCGKSWWGDYADCGPLPKGASVAVGQAQHLYPTFTYFWSINEDKQPRNGFSAKTPTSALRGEPQRTLQRADGNWCDMRNGFRLPDLLNVAFKYNPSSEVAYKEALMKDLNYDETSASRCAAAISFSNDVFEQRR